MLGAIVKASAKSLVKDKAKNFPKTNKFCKSIISLPNHPWLTDAEIETVADKVKDFYK